METLSVAPSSTVAPWDHLTSLVLEEHDLAGFLSQVARHAVVSLGHHEADILCGITLLRQRKPATVASCSDGARRLDEIQWGLGDGPGLTAAREHQPVFVPDVATADRWPKFTAALLQERIRSVLSVPFELGGDGEAALSLYSRTVTCFDAETIERAQSLVAQYAKALRVGLHFAHYVESAKDLRAALESRTTIDIAVGIIMAENRCGQQDAFQILRAASCSRNRKLRDVAARVVRALGQPEPATHFEL